MTAGGGAGAGLGASGGGSGSSPFGSAAGAGATGLPAGAAGFSCVSAQNQLPGGQFGSFDCADAVDAAKAKAAANGAATPSRESLREKLEGRLIIGTCLLPGARHGAVEATEVPRGFPRNRPES